MTIPSKQKVHLIGIGGIGVSSLAQWYKQHNWSVTGSDQADSDIIRQLQKKGIRIRLGHRSANIGVGTNLVIYSNAVQKNNSELKKSRKLGIRTVSYPQALGELTRANKTVAIAGSHGKSTTTAITSLIFVSAGMDPTVILGTKLKQFGKPNGQNYRNGKSKYLIIEADEYRGAFWNYSPTLSIITNIDAEHLDFYKNLRNVKNSFLKFIKQTNENGTLILNRDDANLWSLRRSIKKVLVDKSLKIKWYSTNDSVTKTIKNNLKLPGKHNLSNAIAAYYAGLEMGIGRRRIINALSGYSGSWRRMELRGKIKLAKRKNGVPVFDDYAHHPTEIRATLSGFRELFPNRKIICVFQPHQSKRLKSLFREFSKCFTEADYLILLPIYKVVGRDKLFHKFSPERLAQLVKKNNKKTEAQYIRSPLYIEDAVKNILSDEEKSVVVMMGAGNIFEFTKHLL